MMLFTIIILLIVLLLVCIYMLYIQYIFIIKHSKMYMYISPDIQRADCV